jgi:tripartite-type tricarboxylate transporter receptor subunit TctC
LERGQLVPLIAITEQRLPDAPNLPAVGEFVKDPAMRTFLTIYLSQGIIGRAVITPKGVPEDRVAALRAAFTATMKDPTFLADIRKQNLELSPLSSSEMESRIQSILATPADQVKAAKAIYQELLRP